MNAKKVFYDSITRDIVELKRKINVLRTDINENYEMKYVLFDGLGFKDYLNSFLNTSKNGIPTFNSNILQTKTYNAFDANYQLMLLNDNNVQTVEYMFALDRAIEQINMMLEQFHKK